MLKYEEVCVAMTAMHEKCVCALERRNLWQHNYKRYIRKFFKNPSEDPMMVSRPASTQIYVFFKQKHAPKNMRERYFSSPSNWKRRRIFASIAPAMCIKIFLHKSCYLSRKIGNMNHCRRCMKDYHTFPRAYKGVCPGRVTFPRPGSRIY